MPSEDQILQYVLFLVGLGRSARSIEARQTTLTQFTEWLQVEGRSLKFEDWTPDLIATFAAKQQLEGITQNRPLSMGGIKKISQSIEAFAIWIASVERSAQEVHACD